jgi:hypothetical protein
MRLTIGENHPVIVDLHGEAARTLPEPGTSVALWFRPESLQFLDRREHVPL